MSKSPYVIQRILEYLGLAHWEDVSVDTFRSALTAMNIKNPEINQMRSELVQRVDENV